MKVEIGAAKPPKPREMYKSQKLNTSLLEEWDKFEDELKSKYSKALIKIAVPKKLNFEVAQEIDKFIVTSDPVTYKNTLSEIGKEKALFGNSLVGIVNKLNSAVNSSIIEGSEQLLEKETSYFKFNFKVNWYKDYYSHVTLDFIFNYTITLPNKSVSFIKGIETPSSGSVKLIKTMITESWWINSNIDPLYDVQIPIVYNPEPSGVVKVMFDTLFLPPIERAPVDRREEFLTAIINGESYGNRLLYIDTVTNVFVQTNSLSERKKIPLEGYMALSKEDIVNFLYKYGIENEDPSLSTKDEPLTLNKLFYDPNGITMGGEVRFDSASLEYRSYNKNEKLAKIKELQDKRHSRTQTEADRDHIVKYQAEIDRHDDHDTITNSGDLTVLEFYKRSPSEFKKFFLRVLRVYKDKYKKNSILPYTFYQIYGVIECVKEYTSKFEEYKKATEDARIAFKNARREDKIKIPNLNPNKQYIPHQAEGVSKCDKAGETLIFNVSPGGGKTGLIITDALNLIYKGKVKHPLIITTNALIGQFVGDIKDFTGETVNPIVINTETIKDWGEDAVLSLIEKAPKNSIFLSTYVFLRLQAEKNDMGGLTFPKVEWLKKVLAPDYIALDEAHYIKNDRLQQKSCMAFRSVKYRRIATGTMMPNAITDLCGQVAFLNPRIFGDKKQFAKDFSLSKVQNRWGGIDDVSSDSKAKIGLRLDNNTFHVQFSEKDWARNLPQLTFTYHSIELSKKQKAAYELLVKDNEARIANNYPELAKKWEAFKRDPTKNEKIISSKFILGLMTNLEQFLTMPRRSEFVKFLAEAGEGVAPSAGDLISPKIHKIDELIDRSIAAGMKCIVATHFIDPALNLMMDSKHKKNSVFFDASHKEALVEFRNNPNKTVMFCVVQNITEGLNLQFCDRIILADIDWTPGKLTQLKARIFRPNIENIGGKLINLNEGKHVFIDYVLCNDSADIVKFCYQTYKKIDNASVLEGINIPLDSYSFPDPETGEIIMMPALPKPRINPDTLHGTWASMEADKYLDKDKQYYEAVFQAIAESKQNMIDRNDAEWIPITHTEPINALGDKILSTPWVVGMPLPKIPNHISIANYLDREGIENYVDEEYDEVEESKGKKEKEDEFKIEYQKKLSEVLLKRPVMTEFGAGTIVKVNSTSVGIKFNSGRPQATINMAKVLLYDKPSISVKREKIIKDSVIQPTREKIIREKVVRPEIEDAIEDKVVKPTREKIIKVIEEEVEDNAIDIEFSVYNGIATLVAKHEDPDAEKLRKVGFVHQGPYWFKKIISKGAAATIIKEIQEGYTIPEDNYKEILKTLKYFNKDGYKFDFNREDIRDFIKEKHEPKKRDVIKLMPLIRNGVLFLTADVKTNPSLLDFQFRQRKGMWYHFGVNKDNIKHLIKQIESLGLTISNKEIFFQNARAFKYKLD